MENKEDINDSNSTVATKGRGLLIALYFGGKKQLSKLPAPLLCACCYCVAGTTCCWFVVAVLYVSTKYCLILQWLRMECEILVFESVESEHTIKMRGFPQRCWMRTATYRRWQFAITFPSMDFWRTSWRYVQYIHNGIIWPQYRPAFKLLQCSAESSNDGKRFLESSDYVWSATSSINRTANS